MHSILQILPLYQRIKWLFFYHYFIIHVWRLFLMYLVYNANSNKPYRDIKNICAKVDKLDTEVINGGWSTGIGKTRALRTFFLHLTGGKFNICWCWFYLENVFKNKRMSQLENIAQLLYQHTVKRKYLHCMRWVSSNGNVSLYLENTAETEKDYFTAIS